MRRILLFFLCVSLFSCFSGDSKNTRKELDDLNAQLDSLENQIEEFKSVWYSINNIYLPEDLYFGDEWVPISSPFVRKKLIDAIKYFITTSATRQRVNNYFRQASLYFPIFDSALTADSLPLDLKYLAVAESELDLMATSRVGAGGIWQIMPRTARELDLSVNRYIDERRDLLQSTRGALRKLKDEYPKCFNDWFLTMACYNAGVSRVQRAVSQHADSSYFDLILTRETMNYVYWILAMKIIMENPDRYGFDLNSNEGIETEIIEYSTCCRKPRSLIEVARELNISAAELKYLNPKFQRDTIPRGKWLIVISRGKPATDSLSVSDSAKNQSVH